VIRYRHTPAFAGVELEVTSFQTDLSRDVVEHRPHRGRGAQLSDRGQAPRRDTLSVALTGDADEITAKRDALVRLADSGAARLFVHPLDGSWMARCTAFSETLDTRATYSITLVEDVPFTARMPERVMDPAERVTLQDVEAAADAYDAEVALLRDDSGATLLPEDSPSGAESLAMVESWGQESGASSSAPVRSELADLEVYRERSSTAQEALFHSEEPAAWRAARKLAQLRGTIELYQAGLQLVTFGNHEVTLGDAMPLISFLSQIYGAADAGRLLGEVMRLNRVANPLRVPAGSRLTLPRL